MPGRLLPATCSVDRVADDSDVSQMKQYMSDLGADMNGDEREWRGLPKPNALQVWDKDAAFQGASGRPGSVACVRDECDRQTWRSGALCMRCRITESKLQRCKSGNKGLQDLRQRIMCASCSDAIEDAMRPFALVGPISCGA